MCHDILAIRHIICFPSGLGFLTHEPEFFNPHPRALASRLRGRRHPVPSLPVTGGRTYGGSAYGFSTLADGAQKEVDVSAMADEGTKTGADDDDDDGDSADDDGVDDDDSSSASSEADSFNAVSGGGT